MVEPVLPEAAISWLCPVDQRCQGAELRAVVRLRPSWRSRTRPAPVSARRDASETAGWEIPA